MLGASITAHAAETVTPVTPTGATDVDTATLPKVAGFYEAVVVLPEASSTHFYDPSGNKLPAAVAPTIRPFVVAPGVLYVYPFKLFGGTLSTSFIQPIEELHYNIGNTTPEVKTFGFADAFSQVMFWNKNLGLAGATPGHIPLAYGLSMGAGFALVIPDGGYSRTRALNLSSNSLVLDPNVALTYNTGPTLSFGDNTQLSMQAFYAVPLENPSSHYTTGHIFEQDWAITEQFGKLRVGATGYYQTQLTSDHGNGFFIPNGGNKYAQSAIGPIAQYFFPRYNTFVKAKWDYTFYHKNYVNAQMLVVTVGTRF